MYADRTGNTHSADVKHGSQTLGMIAYTGPTRGRLKVQTETRGQLLIAKLVEDTGFVKKRVLFHLNASQGGLR